MVSRLELASRCLLNTPVIIKAGCRVGVWGEGRSIGKGGRAEGVPRRKGIREEVLGKEGRGNWVPIKERKEWILHGKE